MKFTNLKVAKVYAAYKAWERQGAQSVALRPHWDGKTNKAYWTIEYWPWTHLGQAREDILWVRPDPRYRCGKKQLA